MGYHIQPVVEAAVHFAVQTAQVSSIVEALVVVGGETGSRRRRAAEAGSLLVLEAGLEVDTCQLVARHTAVAVVAVAGTLDDQVEACGLDIAVEDERIGAVT